MSGTFRSHSSTGNLRAMTEALPQKTRVAVVLPCYRVLPHIQKTLAGIGPEVWRIFVVDDACPDQSGDFVKRHCRDPRIEVLYHEKNQGVGGAVLTGYQAALDAGADIIVKLDGDGQMDPGLVTDVIAPIVAGEADYTKGNRFFDPEGVRTMPRLRLFGNAVLSLMTKLSSGYWNLFDPTNGYTAIHARVARRLPFHKISKGYFFETDILFRLNTLRAVVMDVPMNPRYGTEKSNLKVSRILGEFLFKHLRNFLKRIFYNYYLRDMSLASLELPLGVFFFFSGGFYGACHWARSSQAGVVTPAGTVMLSVMLIVIGLQFVMAFLAYDIASVPNRPLTSS